MILQHFNLNMASLTIQFIVFGKLVLHFKKLPKYGGLENKKQAHRRTYNRSRSIQVATDEKYGHALDQFLGVHNLKSFTLPTKLQSHF